MDNDTSQIGLYDKITISFAILTSIPTLFDSGFFSAIMNFVSVFIFFKVMQLLWAWISSDL